MALSNHAELLAAVGAWSFNRTDLPTAELVSLGEARLNRDLRLAAMETEAEIAAEAGDSLLAPPDDMIAPIRLWRDEPAAAGGRVELIRMAPSRLPPDVSGGWPRRYAAAGRGLRLAGACPAAATFRLRHLQALGLSAARPQNWLLTHHPDAYLAAALVEAALWAQDDEQAARWQARYAAAIDGARTADALARRLPLRTELAALSGAHEQMNEE